MRRCLDPQTPPEARPLGGPKHLQTQGIWIILEDHRALETNAMAREKPNESDYRVISVIRSYSHPIVNWKLGIPWHTPTTVI